MQVTMAIRPAAPADREPKVQAPTGASHPLRPRRVEAPKWGMPEAGMPSRKREAIPGIIAVQLSCTGTTGREARSSKPKYLKVGNFRLKMG